MTNSAIKKLLSVELQEFLGTKHYSKKQLVKMEPLTKKSSEIS